MPATSPHGLVTGPRTAWVVALIPLLLALAIIGGVGEGEREQVSTDSLPAGYDSTAGTALLDELPAETTTAAVVLFTTDSGDLSRARVWSLLRSSRACVLSSRLEGGANVVGEAVVAGTPLVASRIPGSVGLLGDDYPGLFPAGDTRALAAALWRAETDATFLDGLRERCARLAPLFDPRRETDSWRDLLAELVR